MTRNIICPFRILHSVVLDNGPWFISKPFQQFCIEYGIKNVYSTPRYLQSNGQAEVINKTLLDYLKKRLTSARGKWVDKLPIMLWAYCTTPKQPTGETPYALAFGAEALIPIESRLGTLFTCNTSGLSHALDELEEKRDRAAMRIVEYHR